LLLPVYVNSFFLPDYYQIIGDRVENVFEFALR